MAALQRWVKGSRGGGEEKFEAAEEEWWRSLIGAQAPLRLREGGGEVGVAHEVVEVEFKRYEIATIPSSGFRAGFDR
jgi:hypothetical protein